MWGAAALAESPTPISIQRMQYAISSLYAIRKIRTHKMALSRRANQIHPAVKFCLAAQAVSFTGLVSSRERAFQTVDVLTVIGLVMTRGLP
jgi:hypothetical protein